MNRADVREGQRWTRAQAAKNAVVYTAAVVALALARPLPARALRALGRFVALVAWTFAHGARRTALANVARALPDLEPRAQRALVRHAYRTLGEHLGETVLLLHGAAPGVSLCEESRVAICAEARARGVIFASAHLGPWESVAAALV